MTANARLREIAQELDEGKSPAQETVRTFIGWFGAQRRGYWVVREIRDTLKSLNIRTQPDFESVFIDSLISFTLDDGQGDPNAEAAARNSGADLSVDPGIKGSVLGEGNDPTYRIGKLESANRKPLRVAPDWPTTKATTLMLVHDYSQLPVMTSDRDVKGMISWRTIGSRLALGKSTAVVRECMEAAHVVPASNSLFSVISQIVKYESVLVRAEDRTIAGIVTTSDLSVQFRQLSEPFLLLGEIENHIRTLIEGYFDVAELSDANDGPDTTRRINSVADLTFGGYIRLLQREEKWEKIDLDVDRVVFTEELNRIRKIRNGVVHFDSDGITEEDQETLRRFVQFLQQLRSIVRSTG